MDAKGGHSQVQIKWADEYGRALRCKNEKVDGKGGIMMCKLKGQTEKGHYDVQIKKCMKRWHYDVQIKRVDG